MPDTPTPLTLDEIEALEDQIGDQSVVLIGSWKLRKILTAATEYARLNVVTAREALEGAYREGHADGWVAGELGSERQASEDWENSGAKEVADEIAARGEGMTPFTDNRTDLERWDAAHGQMRRILDKVLRENVRLRRELLEKKRTIHDMQDEVLARRRARAEAGAITSGRYAEWLDSERGNVGGTL